MATSAVTDSVQLRTALAGAQELLIETVMDAGKMHAEIEALRVHVAVLGADWSAYARIAKIDSSTFTGK